MTDANCVRCRGAGWLREHLSFGGEVVRLRRCACNPEPVADPAKAASTTPRKAQRPQWWNDR